jgi:hypothetical protein
MQGVNAAVITKCVLLVFGLGLMVIFMQIAMNQARLTSCSSGSSDNTQCLAPSVANFGLTSDGPERKVSGPGQQASP